MPERLLGDSIPVSGGVDVTFREPLGVVGLIVPWNFPLTIASWKMAPALAAGNTLVLKPAELTPLTAIEFGRIAREAGIPDGVVNILVGPGSKVGRRLVEHPDVAKVAFTGSTEVGRRIAEGAAGTIKRVTLELGGKSANVVFADADLERAAARGPSRRLRQRRSGLLRPLPHPGRKERLRRLPLPDEAGGRGLQVGDPFDENRHGTPDLRGPPRDRLLLRPRGRARGDKGLRPAGQRLLVPADGARAPLERRQGRGRRSSARSSP